MKTATTSVELPCTREELWTCFFDEAFLRALYLEELDYRAFAVIEMGEASRKLRIVPKLNLPSPVAKLIGDSFAFEDHGTLNDKRDEWTWRMLQPANLDPKSKPRKDVVAMHGSVHVEETSPGKCVRTDTFNVEAKVFGLGSVIESSIEKELLSGRAKEHAFLAEWLKRG